ncbi:MAG: septum formation family protein [Actinomycetales bacterium]|nr:septum formation family protein [Actinomycetales bacterium]
MELLGRYLVAACLIAAVGPLALPTPAHAAPREPRPGDCYDYPRFATVKAAEASPVPCRRRHAAETFLVDRLPASLGPPRAATYAERAAAARPCTEQAMHRAIGLGSRDIPSRFEVVVVFPTNAQWRQGARWMRCDAALLHGSTYARLAGALSEVIAKAAPRAFDFCTPGVPGSKAKVASRCTRPRRDWILIDEPRIAAATAAFPGPDASAREAKALCRRAAARYDDPENRWWAIWPKRAGWRAGYRLAMCFVPYAAYRAGR